jgi:hypothetical protein
MSQSIILACAGACDLSTFADLLTPMAQARGATLARYDRELQIIGAEHSFYLMLTEMNDQDGIALDYESNEDLDEQFRREVLDLRFYSLRFNDFDLTRAVLLELVTKLGALGMDPWMDTDYGWVIRGAEMVATMNRDPLWDWRKPDPG